MRSRPPQSPGIAVPGFVLVVTFSLCLGASGCQHAKVNAEREKSTKAYREHLRAVPAGGETPEQAAQTAALRQKVLHDEWMERGYRPGNEKGGEGVFQSMAGKKFLSALWYPFKLVGECWGYTFGGDRPNRAARMMEDTASPDTRRRGINDLVRWDFAQDGPYVKRYRQIAANDPDPLVRATALRALNRARDAGARPIFIQALGDAAPEVRLEAAKALNNLPDPNAAAPLIRVVTNAEEDRDVRIAAADALRHYKSLEVARALIPRLGEGDFGIAWQSRRSLRRITGKDLRYDEAGWLSYITGPEKPFG